MLFFPLILLLPFSQFQIILLNAKTITQEDNPLPSSQEQLPNDGIVNYHISIFNFKNPPNGFRPMRWGSVQWDLPIGQCGCRGFGPSQWPMPG
jgi:hypothetical protein